jgi:hypothetical protein
LEKQLGKIHSNDSKQDIKDVSKEPEFLYKSTIQNVSLQRREMCPDTTEPNYQLRHQKAGDKYQAYQQ